MRIAPHLRQEKEGEWDAAMQDLHLPATCNMMKAAVWSERQRFPPSFMWSSITLHSCGVCFDQMSHLHFALCSFWPRGGDYKSFNIKTLNLCRGRANISHASCGTLPHENEVNGILTSNMIACSNGDTFGSYIKVDWGCIFWAIGIFWYITHYSVEFNPDMTNWRFRRLLVKML